MAQLLIDKGFIDKVIFYEDHKDLRGKLQKLDIEGERKIYIDFLYTLLSAPILVDSIEELITNNQRNQIRKEIHAINPVLFHFYESNKLQASNVLNSMVCASSFAGDPELMPGYLFVKFKDLQKKLSGKEDVMSVHNYKAHFNNKEKLEIVMQTTYFLEDFLEAAIRGEIK